MKSFAQLSRMKKTFLAMLLLALGLFSLAQSTHTGSPNKKTATNSQPIITGAERMATYLPLIKGKRVALFANQTSLVCRTHLVDTLLKKGINVVKIFGPEHGFRGDADAGEQVNNLTDRKTGIPIISLYGDHKKPTAADLGDVDMILFDIQDVGVRFYTYISSLEYVMEAALENHKPLLILDRPNPNGFYIDGPVLDKKFKSFIGMQPIPIVYGMTIGEYALMLLGEKWLNEKAIAAANPQKSKERTTDSAYYVKVIPCSNYDHKKKYALPVNPSPNLKEMQSVYWYPSTCFFEGTVFSEGRGTDKPFQIFGHPSLSKNLYEFTPKPNAGAKSSKCFYQKCYGWNLSGTVDEVLKKVNGRIQLQYFIKAYELFPGKDSFFLKNNFIDKLAGNDLFRQQISQGLSENTIRKSWEPGLLAFKAIRKKYLLYPDFE